MASTEKHIVLITGANSGIGFGLAELLLADASKHVLLGSRSTEKGEAAIRELQSRGPPGIVELLQLDVADEDSIAAAAKSVEMKHGRLDVLVNNAAVAFPSGSMAQQMATAFQTNATGPLLMLEAFVPLLKKAHGPPRVVNISSGWGSPTRRLDPNAPGYNIRGGVQYRASKGALNWVTAEQIFEFREQGFKVFAYFPGFVASNLGSHNTVENGAKPTLEGAAPIVRIVNGERDAEAGCFLHVDGHYE